MAAARKGDTISIHYTGTLEDGTVFDSTSERGPLTLRLGDCVTLQALEEELVGLEPGQKRTVELRSRQAFGAYRKNMVRVLRRDTLPVPDGVQAGDRLRIDTGDGTLSQVRVIRVVDGEVMVDMNHPLAGKTLRFEVELLDILEA